MSGISPYAITGFDLTAGQARRLGKIAQRCGSMYVSPLPDSRSLLVLGFAPIKTMAPLLWVEVVEPEPTMLLCWDTGASWEPDE